MSGHSPLIGDDRPSVTASAQLRAPPVFSRFSTQTTQTRYDTGLKKPNRRVERLNALLGESAYLVQDTFSLADVAVASYLLYVVQFFPTINLTRWPNLVRYMRDCASRPSYQQAFGTNVQSFLLERLDTMMEKEDDNNKKNNNKKLFGMF